MASKRKSINQKDSKTSAEQVSFSVEPGTKVKITVDVGEEVVDGKVPLTVHIEQVNRIAIPAAEIPAVEPEPGLEVDIPVVKPAKRWVALEALKGRLRTYDLATWLFICAIGVYLITRLIGLTQFPVYFFTDEAIQTQSVIDLIENGYKDPSGVWFPTYFRNGDYYNIGVSVYLQWLPAILFGKSAVATRVTSVLVTLIAAISIGLILRDVFKLKYWWTGILFLSITPAWFLHSRTAFETVEFVAFYAGMLGAYLFYRHISPRYLYIAVFLGALSFYTYSPAQVILPLTALGLLISDWRYHWEQRRTILLGFAMAAILALPYIRFSINNPSVPFAHLHTLWSYWFENIPVSEKVSHYLSEFGVGLSPWYWYVPNDRDLSRHLMKGYGNIMLATLPFALLGLAQTLRNLRLPAYRAILIALVISPAAAALVQISITRTLVFVVPAAILTAIGLEQVLGWIENPKERLAALREGPGPSPRRIAAALVIVVLGILIASFLEQAINSLVVWALSILLALQISGVLERMAQSLVGEGVSRKPRLWKFSQSTLALFAFIILAGVNFRMLNNALTNGPLWFRDYGLGGMQYGAFQIFDVIDQYRREHPDSQIIFSPDWANGANVLARFFLDDFSSIQVGSVRGHLTQKLPLDEDTLFIMTPQEYDIIKENPKLTDIDVETTVPYPDGTPGFYFVHLRYADNIDEIFAAEKATREALRESTLMIDGQEVKLRYSYLDAEMQDKWIALVFDNDPFTVAKTFETNPFVLEMEFPKVRTLNGFSIIIGTAHVQLTVKCYSASGAEPVTYSFEGQGTRQQPELSFDFPEPTQSQTIHLEVLDPQAPDQSKVHIWELKLR
ncbi:MAG TPA: glycosyltransferase family 39 protein [Anaerolineales bacterium]|nr:glycosyltransferase family 39 protein [Anaerolineales bacterium]